MQDRDKNTGKNMANRIPKITWKNFSLEGDTTSANAILTNITDTSGTEVGMVVTGTGIPTDTTVLSFTATTITLSANATASNTGVTFSLFFLLEFDLPPTGDNLNEKERANTKRSVSGNGSTQHQFNFIEERIGPKFAFITEAIQASTRTFMETHALKGEAFRYFESKDEVSFRTVRLDRFDYTPKRIFPDNTGGFVYDFDLRMRRTL